MHKRVCKKARQLLVMLCWQAFVTLVATELANVIREALRVVTG